MTHSLPRLALVAVLATSCGDNQVQPDASLHRDAPALDAPSFPPAPVLGTQLDRMGRPLIGTGLIAMLASASDVTTMQDNYSLGAVPAAWPDLVIRPGTPDVTVKLELASNLAILDVLDQGSGLANGGCQNQALYNNLPSGGGVAAADSYAELARLLADDQLYVDTAKGSCTKYFSVELEYATHGVLLHTECGGRAPSHDIADTSYSLLLAGLSGFSSDGNLTPFVTDGVVPVHSDVHDATFPFLGDPHGP